METQFLVEENFLATKLQNVEYSDQIQYYGKLMNKLLMYKLNFNDVNFTKSIYWFA